MSTFAVVIKSIRAIEPHPNADALEFAIIDGYRSIVKKGQFRVGDLVAYIPEGAILPDWLLKRLDLWDESKNCGRLSGKHGNVVKAIKLRGELSQGICYGVVNGDSSSRIVTDENGSCIFVGEGDDVTELLGITKYEPPVPASMAGEVFNAGQKLTLAFDIENWKAYPDVLQDGEKVIFTEKIHGTFTGIAILPYKDAHPEAFGKKKNILIFSKGLGAKGLVFKNNERNANNIYIRATRELIERIDEWQNDNCDDLTEPHFILGETYGQGIQDLTYGQMLGFRVFAAACGYRGNQHFYNWSTIEGSMKEWFGFDTVPVLYKGPFSVDVMNAYTNGKTTIGGNHIREGIVIVPVIERVHPVIGRVCLKSVSADYLTRKNATEYN